MGKSKKAKTKKVQVKPYNKRIHSKTKTVARKAGDTPVQAPTIPFEPEHRILLVGEGDFSFSHSLLTTHGCSSLIATCYDGHSAVLEKYPQAAACIEELESESDTRIFYDIDATKLGNAPKEIKNRTFDRIVFNFPHVGGLTKDVNRQVRHNQELLVGFFRSALLLLAPRGSIVLTLFDGEPYTLWNVRDLGRHVGLRVGRSFRFQANAYPGYKHARTLGNIRDGAGWKGEDRGARTYMFEIDDGEHRQVPRKRAKQEDSDDSED